MSNIASNKMGNNGGRMYSFLNKPVLIDCNFVVDSTNANGLGVSSLHGAGVQNVYMNTSAGAPALTPAMGVARSYGILGASAVSNTGSSVVTGNLGIYPGTAITGFPPGTVSGVINATNIAAQQAQAAALAAYTDLQARSSTVVATELGGTSLAAGVYSAASGTFTLNGTLTLTGSATDVYVFKTATTLVTGATSTPVISLGAVLPQNIYWVVGSSATLFSANAGTHSGNVIALTSITDTLGGTVNGSLIALNGAVTLSAAAAINATPLLAVPAVGNPNPLPGYVWIQLANNYSKYAGSFNGFVSPLSGSNLAINSTALTVGKPYVIVAPGHSAAGQVTIAPVADVAGSKAGTWFSLPDAYGNIFIVWFRVSGVGIAPVGVSGTLVQIDLVANDSAATIGAKIVVVLNALLAKTLQNPSAPAGVFSFTASGTTTVTAVNTSAMPYELPGPPAEGLVPTGFTFAWPVNDRYLANWKALGLPAGVLPAVGASFIAKLSGTGASTGLVKAVGVSGIDSMEVIGDPSVSLGPIPQGGSPNVGGWVMAQMLSNGAVSAPLDSSVVYISFVVEAGSMVIAGL